MSLSETKDEVRTSSKRSRFGEGDEEDTPSKRSLSEKNETKNKSVYNQKRQTSPVPSCVSVKSDRSMRQPIQFKGDISTEQSQFDQKRPTSPVPSCVSMKSDRSMRQPIQFKDGDISTEQSLNYQKRETSPVPSCVSMKSDQSMGTPIVFKEGDISTEQRCTAKEEPLKIIQHGSKNDTQEKDEFVMICQQDLKSNLKKRFQYVSEGFAKQGNSTLLNHIYTELYITVGGKGEVNNEHEVRQIETTTKKPTRTETAIKCNDIFKPIPGEDKPIRTVLTKGVAGIGKTVSVQKFILDWAEGKANQDVQFVFSLPFRDLNLMKEKELNLIQLINKFSIETKTAGISNYNKYKVLFIFDGLDECRLPLDFKNNKTCCDVTESTTVDILLTNLIRGNLLPSALLWITTRPAAANQFPSECVDQVTEVRGFNDLQKEEYFRKRFSDEDLASRIISHIKTSRSLHIMCHIPVFCWISATVLETMLKEAEKNEVPRTLTQMYGHFLLIQTCVKNRKYNKATVTNLLQSKSDKEMILKLSKLAFQQLEKGNLIFYEEDLRECDIDVTEASEYSALCTEIFIEESGLYKEKVFSFVHLSFQEFLAAVHALESCLGKKEVIFPPTKFTDHHDYEVSDLHRRAVDHALQSENGHLDLFLRFLLGLSLEYNKHLIRGILTNTESRTLGSEETVKRTVEYLSEKIKNESSPERIINLFHCLNELGSNSLVEDIQTSLKSGTLSETELEPHQCSALAYLLLMSEEVLEEFNMKTYKTSVSGYQRLLPVVKTCKRAQLDGCNLKYKSCETLAISLQTPNCPLRELDLSYNPLQDKGVELLCSGPSSPFFNIQTLVLSGCGITKIGCASLLSALKSKHLKKLDLSYNQPEDSVKQLSALLEDPLCRLETLRLSGCLVTEEHCSNLVSALKSNSSHLTELDLSNNDLKSLGVNHLSAMLEDPQCRLETLRLSGCLVTEEGCASLVSALKSNPSHLRDLDLSYNHLGDLGTRLLSAGLEDPHWRLEKLSMDYGGEGRLRTGLKKYVCDLTLDLNTINRNLSLSEKNRMVTWREDEQPYPDHPERFDYCKQVLCREGLSGRCYWEVEWGGRGAEIGVTYKGINRKGVGDDCLLGYNNKSWSLNCYANSYSVWHNNKTTVLPVTSSDSHRVGVYLDWPAGTLSFYRVSSDTLTHLYTFNTTFTELLYPGFMVYTDSTVSLCQMVPVSNTT